MARPTPAIRAKLSQARPMLLSGLNAKEVAYEVGLSERCVYYLAYRIGLRRRFITDDEYDAVLTGRSRLTARASVRPSEA